MASEHNQSVDRYGGDYGIYMKDTFAGFQEFISINFGFEGALTKVEGFILA